MEDASLIDKTANVWLMSLIAQEEQMIVCVCLWWYQKN